MSFIMLPACLTLNTVDLKDITSGSTTSFSISFGWWSGAVCIPCQPYLGIGLTNLRLHMASCHKDCGSVPEAGTP